MDLSKETLVNQFNKRENITEGGNKFQDTVVAVCNKGTAEIWLITGLQETAKGTELLGYYSNGHKWHWFKEDYDALCTDTDLEGRLCAEELSVAQFLFKYYRSKDVITLEVFEQYLIAEFKLHPVADYDTSALFCSIAYTKSKRQRVIMIPGVGEMASVNMAIPVETLYDEFKNGYTEFDFQSILADDNSLRYVLQKANDLSEYLTEDRVTGRCISHEEFLDIADEDMPHRIMQDLVLIYYFNLSHDERGVMSTLVSSKLAETYDFSEDFLYSAFCKKLNPLTQVFFTPMSKLLGKMFSKDFDDVEQLMEECVPPLYVLSNKINCNGASVIFTDALEKVSLEFECDLLILPSSKHEVLIVPLEDGLTDEATASFKDMVVSINESVVAPADVLTNNLYMFSSESKELTIV